MAPLNTNTDIQSILNQVQSTLSNLGTSSTGASSENTQFINSVWGLVGESEQAIRGNEEQKAQAISGIVQNIMSIISGLGTKENSAATKEVKKNTKTEQEIDNKATTTTTETESKVKEIMSNIANNTASISQAMTAIESLGGDNGILAEAKAKLEEQTKIIEANQEILNNGVSTPEAKQAALEAIIGASQEISNLCLSITDVQKEIEAQNSIVENSANNITGLIEDTVSTVAGGIEKLQSLKQNAEVQTTIESTSAINGYRNEFVGEKATEMGSSTSVIPGLGQTAAQHLIQVGLDQTMAGKTRIGGSAANLTNLTKMIGQMGSDLSTISGNIGQVSELGNNVVKLIGQYDTKLQPLITATGSWATVAEGQKQLDEAIKEYQAQTNTTNVLQNPWETAATNKQNSSEEQNGMFNFDTKIFKEAFGV